MLCNPLTTIRVNSFRGLAIAATAAACLATAPGARADVIQTFYLHNINFADGGYASGSFTLDETYGQPYDVNITITDPVLSGYGGSPITFSDDNLSSAFQPSSNVVGIFSYDDDYSGIAFVGVGAIGTTNYALTTDSDFAYYGNSIVVDFLPGGSLSTTPVPEPASLPILAAAVGALLLRRGWLRGRNRA